MGITSMLVGITKQKMHIAGHAGPVCNTMGGTESTRLLSGGAVVPRAYFENWASVLPADRMPMSAAWPRTVERQLSM